MAPTNSSSSLERYLDTGTRSDTDQGLSTEPPAVTALTLLCHRDPKRVGEMAWLAGLEDGQTQPISRLEPNFVERLGGTERPLADPRLSRRPFRLSRRGESYVLDVSGSGIPLEVDGEVVTAQCQVDRERLARGVVLLLGERVALCWHLAIPTAHPPPSFGLVGESLPIRQLRRDIQQVADVDVPVLIRGESGSGKELVARAIQRHSRRRERELQTVNLGAVAPSLAAAELFGAAKGAYSGADRSRPGYFQQCDGGTLFLDEIGEASHEVQAMLLRALESGEVQPVGSPRVQRVDVRVLAATDADLENATKKEAFKAPLLHRLQAFQLTVAPLRERRDDVGRLFFHFLRQALVDCREEHRLAVDSLFGPAFVPARLVARLALQSWPGNARELRNVATQAAIRSRGSEVLRIEDFRWESPIRSVTPRETRPDEAEVTQSPEDDTQAKDAPIRYRDPGSVSSAELRAVLREHDW